MMKILNADPTQSPSTPADLNWASQLQAAESQLHERVWPELDAVYQHTFERVLNAFVTHRVSEEHFLSVSGYGHDDMGRDITDKVFADALQAEAAMVRMQIVSGTHALAVGLHGCLQPGETMLSITGRPYDTLEEVIGLRGTSRHSLKARGIAYAEFSIFEDQEALLESDSPLPAGRPATEFTALQANQIALAHLIFIQRSRGYSVRPSLTIEEIETLIRNIRAIQPEVIVMVDNCYGEFTQHNEPTAVGADLIAGSLIKNPGGGIVPTGGYVAGRRDLVDACADYLTCPGVGTEGGYTFDLTRTILQGLYLAPGVVKEALKGMTLAAHLFEGLGYPTAPHWQETRSDIIQILTLGSAKKLVAFCQTLQKCSPVSSHVTPEPAQPPGYADSIVMAGGTFIDGSTLELSADGPLREPYAVYLQGGLTYAHTRFALKKIVAAFEAV